MRNKIYIGIITLMLSIFVPAFAADEDDFVPADGETVSSTLLENGAVTTAKLADEAVTDAKIATGAVSSSKIGTGAVVNASIAANAITSDKILNDTITTSDIADGAVDGGKIANGSIQGIDVASDTLTAVQIAAGAITNSELAAFAVGTGNIAVGAVGAVQIAADSIGSAHISAGAVANSDLANGAVTSAKIQDATIVAADIAANAITSAHIQNGSITAADLATGAVSTQGTKYAYLEIGTSVRKSLSIGTVGDGFGSCPVLRYDGNDESSAFWSVPVPDDYIPGTDIVVELVWSPSNTNAGNVVWILDYASVAAGEVMPGSSGLIEKTYTQASPGVTLSLATTANNLVVSAADVNPGEMLSMVIRRDGDLPADTYTNSSNLHMAKIKYQAKKPN